MELFNFTAAKKLCDNFVICSNPVNLIQSVFNSGVEQLFFSKKCQAILCRAIAIWAVHPRSTVFVCQVGIFVVQVDWYWQATNYRDRNQDEKKTKRKETESFLVWRFCWFCVYSLVIKRWAGMFSMHCSNNS